MAMKLSSMATSSSFSLSHKSNNLRSLRVFMASTLHSSSTETTKTKKPILPPREVHVQVTHSMPTQKIKLFESFEDWAEENILVHLKPVEKCWQPQDFLPHPESDGFYDQVKELRDRAKEIPDDYFVVLVGDMITEEPLSTYQTMLNTLDGVRDETGASLTSWAVWTRAWTAEENRHGDLLNEYLYLLGRVDMKQVEKTIQYLAGSGMMASKIVKLKLKRKHVEEADQPAEKSSESTTEYTVEGMCIAANIVLAQLPRRAHLHPIMRAVFFMNF